MRKIQLVTSVIFPNGTKFDFKTPVDTATEGEKMQQLLVGLTQTDLKMKFQSSYG